MQTDRIIIIGNLQPDNNRKWGGVRLQNTVIDENGISMCIPATHTKHEFKVAVETERQVLGWTRDEHGNIVDRHPVQVANCVTSGKRDNTQNYVQEQEKKPLLVPEATKSGYAEVPDGAVFDASYPNSNTRRGRVQEGGNVTPTLTAEGTANLMRYQHTRIRRLTERELFRLMDVDDADIDKLLEAGIPKTQLAKMAGNSIVVNVLFHIFRTLLIDSKTPDAETQLTLF